MYEFVEKRIADRYRSDCSSTLKKVQAVLLEEYDIVSSGGDMTVLEVVKNIFHRKQT